MNSTEIVEKISQDSIPFVTPQLSPNAITVLNTRYLKKDEHGTPTETPTDMFRRVAKTIADVECTWGTDIASIEKLYRLFYSMMANLDFLPNSPTLMNAGRELGNLSACFVLEIEDSMDSIFETLKQTALIHKSGGGTGFSFSSIRPSGDYVKSTSGIASGPISFLKIYDKATEIVRQGGVRRGANLGLLRVDHPDIREFITCKNDTTQLTNFNISVAITDEFMNAVKSNSTYNLINPHNNLVVKSENACEIFDLIVKNAHATGEPGIIFIDEINRHNTLINYKLIKAVNPCGEQVLFSSESCCLASINLSNMIDKHNINWSKLGHTIHLAVRFLDNIIEANRFPLPIIEQETKKNRKIGLGIMGFADMLIKLGIPYDSNEALEIAEKIMYYVQTESHEESKHLAKLRGEFPNYRNSTYSHENVICVPLRNATTTTIAPTGTLSIIASCSSGIEPLFALEYTKNVMDGKKLVEVHPELKRNLDFYNVNNFNELPDEIKKVFRTAHDISYEWHVRMQAEFQKYTDNAISKSINFPSTATVEDVRKAYLLAHELYCKGVTIYRDGSRQNQVLTHNKDESRVEDGGEVIAPKPRVRPTTTTGTTEKIKTGCGNLYVTINSDSDGLCEVFCTMGRSGGCTSSQSEAISRLISLALRSKIDLSEIIHQLKGIRCPSPIWQNGKLILSCADAIANSLNSHAGSNTKLITHDDRSNFLCPECNEEVEVSEGCFVCKHCGYSKCQ